MLLLARCRSVREGREASWCSPAPVSLQLAAVRTLSRPKLPSCIAHLPSLFPERLHECSLASVSPSGIGSSDRNSCSAAHRGHGGRERQCDASMPKQACTGGQQQFCSQQSCLIPRTLSSQIVPWLHTVHSACSGQLSSMFQTGEASTNLAAGDLAAASTDWQNTYC